MATGGAPARPDAVADVWAEMVAALANMVESALTAADTAEGGSAAGVAGVMTDDPGRVEGQRGASKPGSGRLHPTVHTGAGPRAHRVDDAPVRPGSAGGPARLGGERHRGDRCRSGPVRSQR